MLAGAGATPPLNYTFCQHSKHNTSGHMFLSSSFTFPVYVLQEMLDCWQEAGATPPVNFAFMFEGEEENGSIGFREAVVDNMPWFGDANLVVISNTVGGGSGFLKPCWVWLTSIECCCM